MLTNENEIKTWIDDINTRNMGQIENYKINNGVLDVDGNVCLHNKNLTAIPVQFGYVSGTFHCSANKLRNLIGCPHTVGNGFMCSDNILETLEGGPNKVRGGYSCYTNKLTNLIGIAQSIEGYIRCDVRRLESLEGLNPEHTDQILGLAKILIPLIEKLKRVDNPNYKFDKGRMVGDIYVPICSESHNLVTTRYWKD